MADSIEAFVQKLQTDGVQAGQEQAKKILDEAHAEAAKVLSDARTEADRIVADARSQAEQGLSHGKDELALAARDAMLRLRETVTGALEALLKLSSAEALRDERFLLSILEDVVGQYAARDAAGERTIEINVDSKMVDVACEWAISRMTGSDKGKGPHVNLKGALASAGFEYTVAEGRVEVTPESISAVLCEIIAPRLRAIIEAAQAPEKE